MNIFEQENKVQILISALEERYNSLHKIRERVQNIGIWALGLLLGVGGWLIQSGVVLNGFQKVIFIIGILVSFFVLRFIYLEDLKKGFRGQQRTAVNIERSLGLFSAKVFNDTEDSIYPKSWENSGSDTGDGKFFNTTYKLLYIGFAFVIIAIIFNGFSIQHNRADFKSNLPSRHWETH